MGSGYLGRDGSILPPHGYSVSHGDPHGSGLSPGEEGPLGRSSTRSLWAKIGTVEGNYGDTQSRTQHGVCSVHPGDPSPGDGRQERTRGGPFLNGRSETEESLDRHRSGVRNECGR